MIEHADQFAAANIPFIFDPGQGLPMFGGEELMKFVSQATWVCVNDYESQLLCDRTGLSLEQLAERVKGLIVTRGGNGSIIFHDGGSTEIPAAPINKAIDPTGCGDAYRAGLLYGLEHGLDWATTGRVAALCGAIKVQHHGTQNHAFDLSHFKALFKRNFNYEI
jgi:adenosine kinase